MNYEVINGDNINKLKNYPDNYFDSVVTDPPYGLGKEPNANELMKDWIEHGYHEIEGKGFMGKEWDAFVPQPIFWQEVFRVLKPGGHVLAFYGTRTYDWGVMSMRFAGFEVRDCIQWLYGSGFPKSHNIGKAIDKIEGNERDVLEYNPNKRTNKAELCIDPLNSLKKEFDLTKGNSEWEGWGTALKPANEPIVLARKPLEKGLSIAENILKWGVGGINIDASRIGSTEDMSNLKAFGSMPQNKSDNKGFSRPWMNDKESILEKQNAALDKMKNLGRFPANIILTHHEDCVCKGTKKVKGDGNFPKTQNTESWKMASKGKSLTPERDYADTNGNEEVENWDCHEDCPIRILDEQSGISKGWDKGKQPRPTNHNWTNKEHLSYHINDKGGASRFFYVAKASKSERNKGLDNSNFHPTVKPIKLMQYLVKMITPPNGIVLDPFCGSGSTGVACKLDGFNFVGIEQDLEYTKIAEARIKNTQIEKKQLEIF